MNYVQIMGGLGNQLFQYTFAKYLEINTEYPVCLYKGFYRMDISGTGISSRDFALDKFDVRCHFADDNITFDKVVTDETLDLEAITDNTFFNGYWQEERFLRLIRHTIDTDIKFRYEYITEAIKETAAEMNACESVAIHVRRKDYLNKYNKDIFYETSLVYYALAVDMIKSCKRDPVLYIFSDDYEYIDSHMNNFCECRTVIIEPHRDYEDLYLMTQAKHHIIANSTFGWWGAALSANPTGITIAPKHWYKDRKDPHIYPDDWIILDNQISLEKISVIIPAYNVEDYVDRCLCSLAEQTYDTKNLEIILIDDASTDDTLSHLEAFESKYPENVILIKMENNRGQGAARNIGLDYANGKYITFVDSDDLIDVSMLYKMMLKAEDYNCDIVECGYRQFSDVKDAISVNDIRESFYMDFHSAEERKNLIISTCAKTAVWGRLYRREFITENGLKFIEKLFFEDIQFSGLAMFLAESYYRINETLYYYYTNNEGTVYSAYKKDKVRQVITVTEGFLAELSIRNMLDDIIVKYRDELRMYCTTKMFVDPLALLVNSGLKLREIISEINCFKEKLLELFPDAASYYLSDEYGICSLAVHLLTSSSIFSEQLIDDVDDQTYIMIDISDDESISDLLMSLRHHFSDIEDLGIISISQHNYRKEHLLIRHIISRYNTIAVAVDKYSDLKDQSDKSSLVSSILSEYPHNRIILMINDLYYDESDSCLGELSKLLECLKAHKKLTIVTAEQNTYSVLRTLLPSIDVSLIQA